MQMTRHATFRSRQRNISQKTIDAICRFGTYRQSRGGCSVMLDRDAIDDAHQTCTKQQYLELLRHAGTYVVVGDGCRVVTAARPKRRFRR